jgi:hypothetical protein
MSVRQITRRLGTFAPRRTAEGLSKQEIIRCLKRYVARELFPHIQNVIAPTILEPPLNTQRAA